MSDDLWYNGPLMLHDLETSGVNPDTDEIVTGTIALTAARPPGGGPRPTKVFEWLVAVEDEIPQQAIDVHGITTAYAREHGKPGAEAVDQMISTIVTLAREGATLIGMNVSFDLTFLDRAARRYGLRSLDERLLPGELKVVDVYVIDKEMVRRKGGRKLTDLCAHYGVKIEGAHDSTADCLAAGRVAWAQCRDFPKIKNAKIEDLHEWQVAWRAKQQRSFASWLKGQAAQEQDPDKRAETLRRADEIRPEWPVIPRLCSCPDGRCPGPSFHDLFEEVEAQS
jgi:DNA polymerase III subunit epsilon